jgi:hypothetical protein
MALSKEKGKRTSSSTATTFKGWNSGPSEKGKKWNLRRVRDEMVVPRQ